MSIVLSKIFLMLSLLITGGNEEERTSKLKSLLVKYNLSAFDTFFLNPELSITISQIRELQHWLSFSPYKGKFKAGVINQAEKLTIEAQNSLLKTLEEPPENAIIVLLTANADFLLPTIISRCQITNLSQKPQISLSEEEIGEYLNVLISLFKPDIGEKFKICQEVAKSREEAIIWLDKAVFVLRKLMIGESTVSKISPYLHFSISSYPFFIRLFTKTKSLIQANANTRLAMENLFLNLSN